LASFPVGTCKAGGGDVPVVSGPGLVPGVIGAAALAQLSVSSAESPVAQCRTGNARNDGQATVKTILKLRAIP
jgi:hypothetical protein